MPSVSRVPSTGNRVSVALLLVVLAACSLLVQANGANQASRMALTAAIAESGTTSLEDYDQTLGADYAVKDGEVFSDKAPGQPLLGVPFWSVYRAAGGDPGTDRRADGHLGLWWLTLWCAAVPGALLAVLLRRHARSVDPALATPVALGLFAGTILLPFSTLLFSHILAAALTMWAYLRLRDAPRGDHAALAWAGAATSAAVVVEYTVGIVALVLLGCAIARYRADARWFVLGTLPAVAVAAAYNWITFGGPLEHPYKHSVFDVHHDTFAGIGMPDPDLFVLVLFGERGLFTLTPVVALAVAGLVAGRRWLERMDVVPPLLILAAYLVFASGWIDATGGWSPGTRHLLPALPFLAAGLTAAWQRWPRLTAAAALWSGALMVLATFTDPQVPTETGSAVRFWLEHLRDGEVVDTVLSPVLGRAGLLVVAGLVGAAVVHLRRTEDAPTHREADEPQISQPGPRLA